MIIRPCALEFRSSRLRRRNLYGEERCNKMELTLTLWQLAGILIAGVVGIITIISVLVASGFRAGKFVTRNDLDRTSDKLEKKIDEEASRLEKKIDEETSRLAVKIDEEASRLEKKIDEEASRLAVKIDEETSRLRAKIDEDISRLEKKIDDNNERMDRRFDEVMLAIQNLGARLETAIMEHTHDEDGVAVFRRHPQMVDAAN